MSMKIENIDAIALSAGPGSYTGLRIGGAVAKALCFDDKIKLVSVPTLEALAKNAACGFGLSICASGIVALAPSHKDLVYYQEFDPSGMKTGDVCFTDSDEFNKLAFGDKCLVGLYPDEIQIGVRIPAARQQTAAALLPLAIEMVLRGEFTDPEKYEPIYIQEFEPKIRARV